MFENKQTYVQSTKNHIIKHLCICALARGTVKKARFTLAGSETVLFLLYIYVCVCVCVRACVRACLPACLPARACMCVCACVRAYACVCTPFSPISPLFKMPRKHIVAMGKASRISDSPTDFEMMMMMM